jgi:hypothetical protein
MDRDHFLERVQSLRQEGKSVRAIAAELGVHPSRVQRALTAIARKSSDQAVGLDNMASGGFVGRHREMAELTAALEGALSGRGGW